jgi:hypothetical protein
MLTIKALVLGDPPSKVFLIKLDETASVDDLRSAVASKITSPGPWFRPLDLNLYVVGEEDLKHNDHRILKESRPDTTSAPNYTQEFITSTFPESSLADPLAKIKDVFQNLAHATGLDLIVTITIPEGAVRATLPPAYSGK